MQCVGGRQRWRTRPGAVIVAGTLAGALLLAAIVLVACQVLWFREYCTLCLASALCSLLIAALVVPEVWAVLQHHGKSWTFHREDRQGD
jgi:hypothetical protein